MQSLSPAHARMRAGSALLRLRLRMQPTRITFQVMLVLPDRHACLDFIDDVAARIECGATVRCTDADPHRHVADAQLAHAVHAMRVHDGESLHCFVENALPFGLCERGVGFVAQPGHAAAFVVIAYPAFETGKRPSMRRSTQARNWSTGNGTSESVKIAAPCSLTLNLPTPAE